MVEVGRPRLVITTVAAILQRVPTRKLLAPAIKRLRVGDQVDAEELIGFFQRNGYNRSDTVREPGEYAIRGGIIDVYPAGLAEPLRLDLFGDTLEAIREFDPMSQRSTGKREAVDLKPASEVLLDEASIARFRAGYRALFGAETGDDQLYEAISAGRKHIGMEHWLPLFHDQLETLFDYLPGAAVTLDAQVEEAITARLEQINEYYEARRGLMKSSERDGTPYKPLPPDRLYLTDDNWQTALRAARGRRIRRLAGARGPRRASRKAAAPAMPSPRRGSARTSICSMRCAIISPSWSPAGRGSW